MVKKGEIDNNEAEVIAEELKTKQINVDKTIDISAN